MMLAQLTSIAVTFNILAGSWPRNPDALPYVCGFALTHPANAGVHRTANQFLRPSPNIRSKQSILFRRLQPPPLSPAG